jgi:ATP synthase subunit 6
MVRSTVGTMRKTNNLVGLIIVLFFFILVLNLIGLIPFGFCLTSQFVLTQFLGFFAIGGLTLKGFQNLSFKFLFVFVPRNVPIFMLPFLMLIELVSFLSRMLSLSIRLFANMVAGHALLHILMGALLLVFSMNSLSIVLLVCFFLPSILIFFIMLLEVGIAFLQAYVFVVLFLIYLTDCYKVH